MLQASLQELGLFRSSCLLFISFQAECSAGKLKANGVQRQHHERAPEKSGWKAQWLEACDQRFAIDQRALVADDVAKAQDMGDPRLQHKQKGTYSFGLERIGWRDPWSGKNNRLPILDTKRIAPTQAQALHQ